MVIPFEKAIKEQQGSYPSQLLAQGESPDKLIKEKQLDPETREELKKNNSKLIGKCISTDLTQKHPKEVVILDVELNNDNRISIHCFHSLFESGGKVIEISDVPEISFDKIMSDVKTLSDIENKSREFIGAMREVSAPNGNASELTSLFRSLQKKLVNEFNQQLSYLIIYDNTPFEIPWEMLQIKPNVYLGASIVTVRWQDIVDQNNWDDENSYINLEIEEKNCCGEIIAYLNSKEFSAITLEKEMLNNFDSVFHEDLHGFLSALNSLKQDISLIFMASHGFYGDDSQTILGGSDSRQQISLRGLSAYNFPCLANTSPLVFLNACHSGRLHDKDPSKIRKPGTLAGFPLFFLARGAKGVIGTLHKVKDDYAAKIANCFFKEYQQNNELSVATILKNIRQKAVDQYVDNPNTENTLLFVYTFMYIYYGNPIVKLNLIKKEGN